MTKIEVTKNADLLSSDVLAEFVDSHFIVGDAFLHSIQPPLSLSHSSVRQVQLLTQLKFHVARRLLQLVVHVTQSLLQLENTSNSILHRLGGRALDVRSLGRGFDSHRGNSCVTTLGKLFTPMCLCHQAANRSWVQFPPGKSCVTTLGKLLTPMCLCHQAV